jgi:hypothetical protein
MFSCLWQYVADFFLAWETFRIKNVEKIKTHFTLSVFFLFFSKIVPFMR